MSRVQRLLDLIQILRSHRFPVTGARLASELGISLRTLYRDIGILQEQGANIDGEPGIGYVLRPGFMLPPLMFTEDEIEAIVLGSRWVADRGDARLSAAARNALTKIAAILPNDLCNTLDATALLVGPGATITAGDEEIPQIRRAIRAERKLEISYHSLNSVESTRTVWPFALGYFEHVRVLVAWCEMRQEFRHFRTDRITSLKITEQRYPRRRQVLLKEWRETEGIPPQ
ncbi:transcriptional regulator [Klebsiella pneumoniae]|uniref:helix-turn-helix transcriptional regulator n=1 Tax=Klebsiella pneumoniae TaxID=573 RepID=UPI000E2DF3F2|nr:YafY family protein [Klebsiella pneumoniae]SXU04812.1 transcriptional regulator [Klebsiella pneumoniae]HBQ8815185.1 YafY family transcriptional regulator [Klebsiella quasipneumoniae]HBR1858774.1 YafY family transcriptional regulator [Klebsiella quasipneumoniae subsp. quasipneumoniae]